MALVKMIALLLVMTIVPAALAETYTVGDTLRWASGVDYTDWVKGKTFKVGDSLKFTYGPSHSVSEMDKDGYENCVGTPIKTYTGGDNTIDLDTVGTKYFICPTSGHCQSGMKVEVTVTAASGGPPTTPSPPSPTPGTPTTPESPPAGKTPTTPPTDSGSTSPPPPKPSAASKGVISYVLVGVSMVLGYGLFM